MTEVLRAVTDCPAMHGDQAHMLLAPIIQPWRSAGGSSRRRPQGSEPMRCFFKAALDLAGAYLGGAQFPNCVHLIVTRNLQSAFRDETLACCAAISDRAPSE